MSWFGILVICGLLGGIGCAIMQAKNQPGATGFWLGFLLGPIGLIIVLCLPKHAPAAGLPRAGGYPVLPPPGWYQDPADPTQHRWWDGQRWSDPPPPLPLPPLPPMPPPAEPRGKWV